MTSSRYSPLLRMSLQYSWYLSAPERPEHARLHDLGEADDGVERRAQLVAHIGEELRFRLVGLLGAGLLLGIFFGELGQLLACCDCAPQVGDRRHQPPLAVDQLLLVRLSAVMSVPTET